MQIVSSALYKPESEVDRNAKLCLKFKNALRSSKYNKKALPYLEERKIDFETADKFDIGWCPENIKFPSYLKSIESLRGRVIFPIKDEYGNIISFSGRLPDKNADGGAKWWHESYAKSFFLYGLNVALEKIMKWNFVIIVEGQIDAITCHKHGLENTVASMGTALTFQHIAKITRFTNNFVFMFDSDNAGRRASKDAMSYLDKFNKYKNEYKSTYDYVDTYVDVNLIKDGVGYDPDEFINKFGVNPIIKRMKQLVADKKANLIGDSGN